MQCSAGFLDSHAEFCREFSGKFERILPRSIGKPWHQLRRSTRQHEAHVVALAVRRGDQPDCPNLTCGTKFLLAVADASGAFDGQPGSASSPSPHCKTGYEHRKGQDEGAGQYVGSVVL